MSRPPVADRADELAGYLEERAIARVTVERDLAARPRVVTAYGGLR